MPAGLEFFNTNGESIIDMTCPNYGLVGKYKMTDLPEGRPKQTTAPSIIKWRYLTLTNRFAPVLFFSGIVNGQRAFAGINTVEVSGNTFTYFFETNATKGQQQEIVNADLMIYVFDLMSTVYPNGSPNGVGFECFNESGNLLFTTALKPLKFVHSSKVAETGTKNGEFEAYGANNGTNGHHTGGSYSDTWVVDGIPLNMTVAASMTRFRYGASGSSTEVSYGEAYFETLIVNNTVNPPQVVAQPIATSISGEDFGGFYGTVLDSESGSAPYIQIIDVTGY